MRICLVSKTSLARDPRAVAEAESLRLAGHDVVGASGVDFEADWVTGPGPPGITDRVLRRTTTDRIGAIASNLSADIYQPVHPNAVDIAKKAAGSESSILVKPGWPRPAEHDLIELAPPEPWRAVPASGRTPALHTSGAARHVERRRSGEVVVAYRRTERNPGRYIESALERAGLEVRRTEIIDWTSIGPSTLAVIIVESPLPSLVVRGENRGVPVVFWVHHGEHHVDANVRLQGHYGAHAVLLAHSWHLTHRFSGLVDRLPFAAAPDLFPQEFKPHDQRRWDVGFVGARSLDGGRYSLREGLLEELRNDLGDDSVAQHSDVTPEQMAELYRDSRAVIDDGAGRHLPITMRVFESTGAGALLLTNPGPGLSLLMEPGRDYLPLTGDTTSITRIVKGDTERVARSGHQTTWSRHTYDQRIVELLSVIDSLREEGLEAPPLWPAETGLSGVVTRFPDAQRILDLGEGLGDRLPGREVWDYARAEDRAEPGTFHLAVVAEGNSAERGRAIAAARIGVVVPVGEADGIAGEVETIHGETTRHDYPDGTVFTFGSSGYRVGSDPDAR